MGFSSVVSPEPACVGATAEGQAYTEVTNAVGGVSWSVCADVEPAFDLMMRNYRSHSGMFTLSDVPDPGTIEVQNVGLDVMIVLEDWAYNSTLNAVFLDEALVLGETVQITYKSVR